MFVLFYNSTCLRYLTKQPKENVLDCLKGNRTENTRFEEMNAEREFQYRIQDKMRERAQNCCHLFGNESAGLLFCTAQSRLNDRHNCHAGTGPG